MATKPLNHSVSSCSEYERCPRRFEYGYVQRLPQDRHVPASWRYGTVVHAALEAAYKQVVMGKPLDATVPTAQAALERAWAKEEMPDDRAWIERAEQVVADAIEQDPIGVHEILGVEQFFKSGMGVGLRFAGYADLVLRRDERTVEIVDHKVTTYARTEEQLHDDRQLNLYGYFALEQYPWAERVVVTHHYPPLRRTVSAELSPDTMRDVVASLVAIARTAEADTEYAPTPGSHCDNCPWADRCEAAPASARS
ncbi:MAG: RecB family exonuclease [Ilumatobacteraceae bacterium]|jgi:RecB family exonuclease